jgi:hypothetical protein
LSRGRGSSPTSNADAFGDQVLRSPHNEWLRPLAEKGIVAGIAGLAFVGSSLM